MIIQSLSQDLAKIAATAGASLVRLESRRGWGLTGIAVAPDLCVTSARAVRRYDRIGATVGGSSCEAEIVGRDPGTDVALLRLDLAALDAPPTVPTWREDADPTPLSVGELVVALARPGRTVRAALGMLGVVGEAFRGPGGAEISRYLELDRELPRGFWGGLLVDAEGQGIGLLTSGLVRDLVLTVPAATLQRVVAQLEQHGHVPQGWLGVGVYPARLPGRLAQQLGQDHAVAVVGLEENGPAAAAGLQVGDLIVAVATDPIRSPLELRSALLDRHDATATVRIVRGGATQDLEVSIGARA